MKLKVKVLYPFYDSEAKVMRTTKENNVFEVTAKRFNEICRKGRYVEVVEEETATTATKKTEK